VLIGRLVKAEPGLYQRQERTVDGNWTNATWKTEEAERCLIALQKLEEEVATGGRAYLYAFYQRTSFSREWALTFEVSQMLKSSPTATNKTLTVSIFPPGLSTNAHPYQLQNEYILFLDKATNGYRFAMGPWYGEFIHVTSNCPVQDKHFGERVQKQYSRSQLIQRLKTIVQDEGHDDKTE
jgi:hypothetical protein